MATRAKLLYSAVLSWLVLCTLSCQVNPQYASFEEPDQRWVSVGAFYGDSPQEQLTVTTVAKAHLKFYEALERTSWLTKVELDFGDDLGWLDFSPQFLTVHTLEANALSQEVKHNYSRPGTYTIKIRVTFWDGGIVMTDWDGSVAKITVTVPPTGHQ